MPRILFVDDHEDTCLMIDRWLGSKGYQVVAATSVAEGVRLARTGSFDVYLLDNRFADGTGRELCEQIRAFDVMTPIIFFSGDHPNRLEAALACGAQGFVLKPEFSALPQAIEQALKATSRTPV